MYAARQNPVPNKHTNKPVAELARGAISKSIDDWNTKGAEQRLSK